MIAIRPPGASARASELRTPSGRIASKDCVRTIRSRQGRVCHRRLHELDAHSSFLAVPSRRSRYSALSSVPITWPPPANATAKPRQVRSVSAWRIKDTHPWTDAHLVDEMRPRTGLAPR